MGTRGYKDHPALFSVVVSFQKSSKLSIKMLSFCSITTCWSTYQTHHYSFCELFTFSSGHWPSKHFRVNEKFNPQPQKHQAAPPPKKRPFGQQLLNSTEPQEIWTLTLRTWGQTSITQSHWFRQQMSASKTEHEIFYKFRRLWTGVPQLQRL